MQCDALNILSYLPVNTWNVHITYVTPLPSKTEAISLTCSRLPIHNAFTRQLCRCHCKEFFPALGCTQAFDTHTDHSFGDCYITPCDSGMASSVSVP
jgi:hypothetical protein